MTWMRGNDALSRAAVRRDVSDGVGRVVGYGERSEPHRGRRFRRSSVRFVSLTAPYGTEGPHRWHPAR